MKNITNLMMNEKFEEVGFVDDYYEETAEFFQNYFRDEKEMKSFFYRVFDNDGVDNTPRRMMNQIVRWVSLSDDLQKIRPGRDPLSVMCVRLCIESICKLNAVESDKASFFSNNLSPQGLDYIDKMYEVIRIEDSETGEEIMEDNSTIDSFEDMIFQIRNEAVHNGDYWSSQVFSRSEEYDWVSSYTDDKKKKRVIYETRIQYDRFIHIFVEAAIRFIYKRIDTIEMSLA